MTEPTAVNFEDGEPIRVYVPSADALPALDCAERIVTLAGDVRAVVRALDSAGHLPGGDWCDGLESLAYELARVKRALRDALDETPERVAARMKLREVTPGGLPAFDLDENEDADDD